MGNAVALADHAASLAKHRELKTLALIWTECRNRFEVATRIADNDARDDAHTAWMAVIAEQGRRTQAWIDARTTCSPNAPSD